MPKQDVMVVHWKEAEVSARLARIAALGYRARWGGADGKIVGEELRRKQPDAIVIDLGRLPSHGRAMAGWLREHKAWRGLPLVFVAGDAEKTERLRADLPDAVYVEGWEEIGAGLREALARPAPTAPARLDRPDYSGTPLARKLGIQADSLLVLLGAPREFPAALGPLPEGVAIGKRVSAKAKVTLCFARSRAELQRRLPAAARALQPGAGLWIAWPKKSSGVASDLDDGVVRALGLASGLVDNKVCAIDAVWSGQRLACRRAAKT